MKLLVLYTRLSGYTAACLRALRKRTDAELLVYAWPNQKNSPFDATAFTDIGDIRSRNDRPLSDIEQTINNFKPDAVLVSGWVDNGYVRICRKLKSQNIPIIAGCDTQWTGTSRQHLASIIAPWYVNKFIDVLWVTGERQRQLAIKLGYSGERCWDGYYACDWEAFAWSGERDELSTGRSKFLYVGRYVEEKGLDTLAAAYRMYCEEVSEPWPLICAGAGPLRDLMIGAGADDRGFVQPTDLPSLMREASAFILPSRFEPWGVVAQEAAASHLPLILSDACGSGTHLLRPYFNGFNFKAGSVNGLAKALTDMHAMTCEQRKSYAEASFQLSRQYTPQRWAEILSHGIGLV